MRSSLILRKVELLMAILLSNNIAQCDDRARDDRAARRPRGATTVRWSVDRAVVGWAWTGKNLILDEALGTSTLDAYFKCSEQIPSDPHALFKSSFSMACVTFSIETTSSLYGASQPYSQSCTLLTQFSNLEKCVCQNSTIRTPPDTPSIVLGSGVLQLFIFLISLQNALGLKLNFRKYPAIHTNHITPQSTTL